MNSSSTYGSSAYQFTPFLDPKLSSALIITFTTTTLFFSVPAFFFNILNVIVFSKQRPIDSVTICFLVLAVVDLLAMFVLSAFSFFQLFTSVGVSWAKNFNAFAFTCSSVFGIMIDLAAAMTSYIALQRGLCVAMPFLTRHLFSRKKSLIIILSCIIFIMGFWLPRGTSFRLLRMPYPLDNSTTFINLYFMPNFMTMLRVYSVTFKGVVASAEYAILVVCACLIAQGMRSSMQLKSTSVQSDANYKAKSETSKEENESESKMEKDQQSSKRKNTKEYLVIKQTFIVVVCHIICTTPGLFASAIMSFHPAIKEGYEYQSLQFTVYTGTYILQGVNALVNFFVYFRFNTRFRQGLQAMCFGAKE